MRYFTRIQNEQEGFKNRFSVENLQENDQNSTVDEPKKIFPGKAITKDEMNNEKLYQQNIQSNYFFRF